MLQHGKKGRCFVNASAALGKAMEDVEFGKWGEVAFAL
jgi:hypothetical protein